jgi:AMMECR1 domain-containing protein
MIRPQDVQRANALHMQRAEEVYASFESQEEPALGVSEAGKLRGCRGLIRELHLRNHQTYRSSTSRIFCASVSDVNGL